MNTQQQVWSRVRGVNFTCEKVPRERVGAKVYDLWVAPYFPTTEMPTVSDDGKPSKLFENTQKYAERVVAGKLNKNNIFNI